MISESIPGIVEDVEDRIACIMKFIRAVERRAAGSISTAIAAYPFLKTLVTNPYDAGLCLGDGLQSVRQHAVYLAREHAIQEIAALLDALLPSRLFKRPAFAVHGIIGFWPDWHRGRASFSQLLVTAGVISTCSPRPWPQICGPIGLRSQQRPTNAALRRRWLQEDLPREACGRLLSPPADDWRPSRRHIQAAIDRSGKSTLGPDGIPAQAFRSLGPLAIDVLHDALRAISSAEGQALLESEYPKFNESLLFCIPKKVSCHDAEHGGFYEPEHTQPLNVTNFDNRIVANGVRLCVESIFASWISPCLRGFLKGRSLLANVIDVDEEVQHTALDSDEGGASFFSTSKELSHQ